MKKINIKKILEVFLILILFEPTIFVKYNKINIIFIVGALISFSYALMIICTKNKKIPIYLMLFVLFRCILIFTTVIGHGDILKIGYQSVIIIALFMYGMIFSEKNEVGRLIDILFYIFATYLFINILLYSAFPNGLYAEREGIHFLGIRTRFTEYAIVFILLDALEYKMKHISFKKFVIFLIIAILNIVLPIIATAIIGITIMWITYMIISKTRIKIDYKVLLIIGIIINCLVVFCRIQNIFSSLIENVLNKSITLTGRTEIWDLSYKYIFNKNIIFGNGLPENGNFVFWRVQLWQAHNQILQILYEAGLIGTMLFYYIWISLTGKLNYCEDKIECAPIIGATIFSFSIMMTTEIYYYYIPFYVLWLICYYSKDISAICKEREGKHDQV